MQGRAEGPDDASQLFGSSLGPHRSDIQRPLSAAMQLEKCKLMGEAAGRAALERLLLESGPESRRSCPFVTMQRCLLTSDTGSLHSACSQKDVFPTLRQPPPRPKCPVGAHSSRAHGGDRAGWRGGVPYLKVSRGRIINFLPLTL